MGPTTPWHIYDTSSPQVAKLKKSMQKAKGRDASPVCWMGDPGQPLLLVHCGPPVKLVANPQHTKHQAEAVGRDTGTGMVFLFCMFCSANSQHYFHTSQPCSFLSATKAQPENSGDQRLLHCSTSTCKASCDCEIDKRGYEIQLDLQVLMCSQLGLE